MQARPQSTAPRAAFLRSYLRLPPGARHHYELMRDGAPCRLYFDLEFKRALNPRIVEADERAMLALFIKLLGAALAKTFDVRCVLLLPAAFTARVRTG